MYNRNINWLVKRRIVFRRDPITDKPTIETHQYKYYENGTHEAYSLFNSKAKITTYRSLKCHFFVLYYLNMDNIINSDFVTLARFIADKENGFVTFFIKNKLLEGMIGDVLQQGGDPPVNKIRKVIFKDFSGLDLKEKLKIVGQLIGRSKLDKNTIYECMLDLAHINKKITIKLLAELLNVSQRTIYRHMCDELKREKQILNEEL